MWNAEHRVVRSSGYHGFDQLEALRRGAEPQRMALREFRVEVTHFSGYSGRGRLKGLGDGGGFSLYRSVSNLGPVGNGQLWDMRCGEDGEMI